MQDLRLRLKQIETQDEEAMKTIEDAIQFINKVIECRARQDDAFEIMGYVRNVRD